VELAIGFKAMLEEKGKGCVSFASKRGWCDRRGGLPCPELLILRPTRNHSQHASQTPNSGRRQAMNGGLIQGSV